MTARIAPIFPIILFLLLAPFDPAVAEERTAAASDVRIIPRPEKLETGEGSFAVTAETRILAEKSRDDVKKVGSYLAEAILKPAGFRLEVSPADGTEEGVILLTTQGADAALGDEGYALTVSPKGVIVRAPKPAGLFYGVQTILQLLPPKAYAAGKSEVTAWDLPAVEIEDRPSFGYRSMMLDVSRYFFNKEFVFRYLDMMAMHKLNVLQLHLVDDPGWRMEIEKYPKLTEIGAWRGKGEKRHGGFYTKKDLREIIEYAAARHIEILPEVELPAHCLPAIIAYPHLSCRGEQLEMPTTHAKWPDVYCPGKETTFEFLQDVIDEVVELFPGKYIHIGGDECKKERWKECPACQKRISDEGLKDEVELQSYMIRRIEKYLLSKNRRLIGWDEILDGGLAENATVMTWYRPDTAMVAANAGNDVIMALTSHCYFDTPESLHPEEPPCATWIPPISFARAYSFDPIPAALAPEKHRHILGGQACVWTDQFLFHPDILPDRPGEGTVRSERYVEYLSLPRMAAMAESVWTPKKMKSWDDFRSRMRRQYSRYAEAGYHFRAPLVEIREEGGKLVLSTDIEGGTIHYTLDRSEPTKDSPAYREPIEKGTEMRTLRASVVVNDVTKSLSTWKGLGRESWKVIHVTDENAPIGATAACAIDGNPASFWSTRMKPRTPPPHEIGVDLGETRRICGFRYLPRQKGPSKGNVGEYAFHVSSDGRDWKEAATGTFAYEEGEPNKEQIVRLEKSVEARCFKFTALPGKDRKKSPTAAAEIEPIFE